MKAQSLLRRLEALKKKEFVEPAPAVTLTDDWYKQKEFILNFLETRYPDAYLAMIAGFDQIEAWDRGRGKSEGLKLKRTKEKLAYEDTEHGRNHTIICKIGDSLEPYLEARIALAEAIDRLKKQS